MKIVIILARQQVFMALVFIFLHIVPLHSPFEDNCSKFCCGNDFDVKRIGSKNFINTFNKSFEI
jgi:hypothetical protein